MSENTGHKTVFVEPALSVVSHTFVLDDTQVTISLAPADAVPWLRDWLAFFPRGVRNRRVAIEVQADASGRFSISTRAGQGTASRRELEPLLDQSLRALLRHAGRHPLAHAALIGDGASAIALTGPSGSGKTTLVKAALAAGLCYWSDEYVLMDGAGILGYPRGLELDACDRVSLLRTWRYQHHPASQIFGHATGLLPPRRIPWRALRAVVHLSDDFGPPLRVHRVPYRAPCWHRPARSELWPVLAHLARRRHILCRGGTVEDRLDLVRTLLTGQM